MARLSEDEKRLLDELNAKASEPDPDEDFEIEVYDTGAGKGARLPFSKGRSWLADNFGIGAETQAAGSASDEGEKTDTPKSPGYFGRRAG